MKEGGTFNLFIVNVFLKNLLSLIYWAREEYEVPQLFWNYHIYY